MSDIAAKLKHSTDHLQWLLDNKITDETQRQKATREIEVARGLLAEWERRQQEEEQREHDDDLRWESRVSEEREATGYWDNCPD